MKCADSAVILNIQQMLYEDLMKSKKLNRKVFNDISIIADRSTDEVIMLFILMVSLNFFILIFSYVVFRFNSF